MESGRAGLDRRGQGADPGSIPPRQRIVAAFAERARTKGIRAIVMADLARELGMSKKTLYQHFQSKDGLVREIVESWVRNTRESAQSPKAPLNDIHELVRWWTDLWVKEQTDFCAEFWRDLEADHPEAWRSFRRLRDAGAAERNRIGRWLRPGIDPMVATELYFAIIGYFNDPVVCAKFGVSPREAVLAALDVWIGGALRPVASPKPNAGTEPDSRAGVG